MLGYKTVQWRMHFTVTNTELKHLDWFWVLVKIHKVKDLFCHFSLIICFHSRGHVWLVICLLVVLQFHLFNSFKVLLEAFCELLGYFDVKVASSVMLRKFILRTWKKERVWKQIGMCLQLYCPFDNHRNQQLINEWTFFLNLTCNTSNSCHKKQ